jgi:leucine dehydrogenase
MVFEHPEFDQHEAIHFFHDQRSGLKAVIAIHSTVLGPAAGGCRRWQYAHDSDALTDVLRLSRGMTYKNAIAGLPFGGGKAVILSDGATQASPELFQAFGRAVGTLGGAYITAEDVGVTLTDLEQVRKATPFVSGLRARGNSAGGDPSPWTALGVFLGIQAAVKARHGADTLNGLKVAVQGVGNVGLNLCRLLHTAGAAVFAADVNPDHLRRACAELPLNQVAASDILFTDVDVLAPCALGKVLSAETIPRIRTPIIAGAANNQLATGDDGLRLVEHDKLYAPDYVINAGGMISVSREYLAQGTQDDVRREVSRIPERLSRIFTEAEGTGQSTHAIADALARCLLAAEADPSQPDQREWMRA